MRSPRRPAEEVTVVSAPHPFTGSPPRGADVATVDSVGERRPDDRARELASALDRIEDHLPFVVRLAREYRHLGIPMEDLVGEGCVGLLQAASRFDPDRGSKFVTYASWWVRKAILSALSERATLVRLPTDQRDRVRRLREAQRALATRLGRTPTREELSRHLESSVREVDRILLLELRDVRLERSRDRVDEPAVVDRLEDRRSPDPERHLIEAESRHLLARCFFRLPHRERVVLYERYGLDGAPPRSLEAIGGHLGVSRERIRQIEAQAIDRLRGMIRRVRSRTSPAGFVSEVEAS